MYIYFYRSVLCVKIEGRLIDACGAIYSATHSSFDSTSFTHLAITFLLFRGELCPRTVFVTNGQYAIAAEKTNDTKKDLTFLHYTTRQRNRNHYYKAWEILFYLYSPPLTVLKCG